MTSLQLVRGVGTIVCDQRARVSIEIEGLLGRCGEAGAVDACARSDALAPGTRAIQRALSKSSIGEPAFHLV
jgi:hypothetical protein